MYPVSFLSKCHHKNRKEVLAVQTSYRKEVLALLSCNCKEVLAVSRTQAQATRNQPQELLLADTKRSSCVCIIFGLYCMLIQSSSKSSYFFLKICLHLALKTSFLIFSTSGLDDCRVCFALTASLSTLYCENSAMIN